jgi:serine/threonine protein kinase
VEKASPELPVKYGKYLTPIYRKMMKKNPSQRPSASELLQEEVFVSLMKDYIKKKKIDSLDLKYIVPKRLAIHKTKEPNKKDRVKLPPISPNFKNTAPSKLKNIKTETSPS